MMMLEDALPSTARKLRVLLADDHRMLLDALSRLLADEFEIVGQCTDGAEALRVARKIAPDAVVLDINMPKVGGLEAGRTLLAELPGTKVVYLTVDEDPHVRAEALRTGASAFVLKRAAATELIDALHVAAAGETYATPLPSDASDAAGAELTPRQREVLKLLAAGNTMSQIAYALGITTRTIAFHKYGMMRALGVESTAQLIALAVRMGLTGR